MNCFDANCSLTTADYPDHDVKPIKKIHADQNAQSPILNTDRTTEGYAFDEIGAPAMLLA